MCSDRCTVHVHTQVHVHCIYIVHVHCIHTLKILPPVHISTPYLLSPSTFHPPPSPLTSTLPPYLLSPSTLTLHRHISTPYLPTSYHPPPSPPHLNLSPHFLTFPPTCLSPHVPQLTSATPTTFPSPSILTPPSHSIFSNVSHPPTHLTVHISPPPPLLPITLHLSPQ